jgi:hypothetical protein
VNQQEFVEAQDKELVRSRIPKECPFCRNISNRKEDEFEVYVSYPFISNEGLWKRCHKEPRIVVICTRCEEEIRAEDLEGRKNED